MNKHKLLIGLLVAGLFTAGLGAGVFPASADQRTYKVTFVGGTTTVVDPGRRRPARPLDQVVIPGAELPVLSIEDITPAEVLEPATGTTPAPPAEPDEAPAEDDRRPPPSRSAARSASRRPPDTPEASGSRRG